MRFRIHLIVQLYASSLCVIFFMCGGKATSYGNGTNSSQPRKIMESTALLLTAPYRLNEHLVLGNPSNAVTDSNQPGNYLMEKPQYALSYSRDNGIPNWVSWHLDNSWLSVTPRQAEYFPDSTLPSGWYRVLATDYSQSGFDRGRVCPLVHRTRNSDDAAATFIMTNIMPLTPGVNRGVWLNLVNYEKTLARQGKELYILAGGVGAVSKIANGHVTVPEKIWQVVLVLPLGDNNLSRVTTTTRTIAVIIPNKNDLGTDWRRFRVSVDKVEALTGLDFFSNLPVPIQRAIQAGIDHG